MPQPNASMPLDKASSIFSPGTHAPRIAVLGSLNMDLVIRVPHAPAAGETLEGHSINHVPGGKGGNQAVAAARQGAAVWLMGAVGDDAHGRALRAALAHDGIDHAGVATAAVAPTGVALILVDDAAQNRIVVIPGANATLQVDTAALTHQLQGASFLLLQLETPLAAVMQAMQAARAAGCPVLLNPAPAQPLPDAAWPMIDLLVVNEGEAAMYAGCPVQTPADAASASASLRLRGPARVVVTLGAAGAVAADSEGCLHHPGLRVAAVDTTAAGDTFIGVLATALGRAEPFQAAVREAIRASALCVTRAGAQPSIPSRADVLASALPPPWLMLRPAVSPG